jgi:hypothetical protein
VRKYRAIVVAGLVLALSAFGCSVDFGEWGVVDLGNWSFRTVGGSGNVVVEEREVSDFSAVELAGWGNLYVEVGETEALRIEGEDNLLEYIETEVRDGVLTIRHRQRVVLRPTSAIEYFLTVTELEAIKVVGAGDINVPRLSGPRFAVTISGAGNVDIDGLEVERVEVDISGAGNTDVGDLVADALEVRMAGLGDLRIDNGEVQTQQITVSGGGNYHARGLQSAEAEVRLSGLGNAMVRVSERLVVNISGAGSVRYLGSPSVEQSVSGLGRVDRLGE